MSTMQIRNVPEEIRRTLKVRAAAGQEVPPDRALGRDATEEVTDRTVVRSP